VEVAGAGSAMSGSDAGSPTARSAAGSATPGSAAGSAGSGSAGSGGAGSGSAAVAAPPVAKLTIESVPAGASVYGPAGALLGKTPLRLEWPVSAEPRAFDLRLAGYRRRVKEVVVSGNTTVRIELERLPVQIRPPGRGSDQDSGPSDNGLMRPQ